MGGDFVLDFVLEDLVVTGSLPAACSALRVCWVRVYSSEGGAVPL